MEKRNYPALYLDADKASNNAQSKYLNLVRAEYALLFLAAVLGLQWSSSTYYDIGYALVFVLAATMLLIRSFKKPEQTWYRCRALAESVKTSTWRYMMRADPFLDAEYIQEPRAEFRNYLREILKANREVGDALASGSSAEDQVTHAMDEIRKKNIDQRKQYYKEHRIQEQRAWYNRRANDNKRAFKRWVLSTVSVYIVAILSVLIRIGQPSWGQQVPTDPLIVLAASLVGWIQIRKFSELASSYTLTAHEIGITFGRLDEVQTEDELSEFVNESELAFSREHTQWVARQHE
ncbi:MAG: DUF4231 domain-containing protein [Desulfobacteraceae bacterium]|nr:DUF4231 domain-containing protein [Desulfobacteraceae bacterium]